MQIELISISKLRIFFCLISFYGSINYMNRSHKYFFFVYLFTYLISVSLDQLIFCIKYT